MSSVTPMLLSVHSRSHKLQTDKKKLSVSRDAAIRSEYFTMIPVPDRVPTYAAELLLVVGAVAVMIAALVLPLSKVDNCVVRYDTKRHGSVDAERN